MPSRSNDHIAPGPAVAALDLVGDPQRRRPHASARATPRRRPRPASGKPSLVSTLSRITAAGARPRPASRSSAAAKAPTSRSRTAEAVGRCPCLDVRRRSRPPATPPVTTRRVASVTPWYAKAVHIAAVVAGERRGQPPGEVVRLGAGVDEQHGVEPGVRRHRRDQPLGQLDRRLVQVAHVRVQPAGLAGDRLGDPWVPVPDARHVVVGIEVAPAVGVGHPDAARADDVDRLVVRQRLHGRPEGRVAPMGQSGDVVADDVSPEPASRPVPADRRAASRSHGRPARCSAPRRSGPRALARTRQDEIAMVTAARAARSSPIRRSSSGSSGVMR